MALLTSAILADVLQTEVLSLSLECGSDSLMSTWAGLRDSFSFSRDLPDDFVVVFAMNYSNVIYRVFLPLESEGCYLFSPTFGKVRSWLDGFFLRNTGSSPIKVFTARRVSGDIYSFSRIQ